MLFASLIDGILNSNLMGQAIILAQLAGSVLLFAVIFGKWRTLAKAKRTTRRISADIMGRMNVLDWHLERNHSSGSSIERIYTACCERLLKLLEPAQVSAIARRTPGAFDTVVLTRLEVNLVQSICDHTLDEEEIKLEDGMGTIATLVALEPMLGLLGTVWGVLDAFADIGAAGSANLATMAPAISAALVTTVVGLLIAISGICFDAGLRSHIRSLDSTLEGFADDLMGRIGLELQGRN